MKEKLLIFMAILMILGLITGCSKNGSEVATHPEDELNAELIYFYYSDSGNESFVIEEREISFANNQDKFTVVLQELIKGPQTPDYRSSIPSETRVYGTMKQGTDLIVNLSEDFCGFGGSVAEIIAVGSVVNTLSTFDSDINRVKILVEGEELIGPSGDPRGFMEPYDNEISPPPVNREITLYFCNEDATDVEPENRIITVNSETSLEDIMKLSLEELIQGPVNSNLHKTIPAEVKVKSMKIEENIACVDFSIEMHTNHWGGSTGEVMTINSIVYTLTEFEGIDKVKMTVEGEPISIEHGPIEDAVGRS